MHNSQVKQDTKKNHLHGAETFMDVRNLNLACKIEPDSPAT